MLRYKWWTLQTSVMRCFSIMLGCFECWIQKAKIYKPFIRTTKEGSTCRLRGSRRAGYEGHCDKVVKNGKDFWMT